MLDVVPTFSSYYWERQNIENLPSFSHFSSFLILLTNAFSAVRAWLQRRRFKHVRDKRNQSAIVLQKG
jgi:hypothetical protein